MTSLGQDIRPPLAPGRPKCNSILHLFGEWLFEAAFIGTEGWSQNLPRKYLIVRKIKFCKKNFVVIMLLIIYYRTIGRFKTSIFGTRGRAEFITRNCERCTIDTLHRSLRVRESGSIGRSV